jgi:hypothetical protein
MYTSIFLLFLSFIQPVRWVMLKGATVKVHGTTNINKFSCAVMDYCAPDTLCFYPQVQPIVMTGVVKLPVMSFDCMNKPMTEGLRKALNAKQFPHLSITFLSLTRYPALKLTEETISGLVSVEMAGVSKKKTVNYRVFMDEQQVIHLVGNQTISFTEFGLTPPRKLGGMIRAGDQLDVEFNINFKVI